MNSQELIHQKEIEQRFAVNPYNGLILPSRYKEYHQAELGSGRTIEVCREFNERTSDLLCQFPEFKTQIISLLSGLEGGKPLKIRVRKITDDYAKSQIAEFTVKQKTPDSKFKIYDEYNIPIPNELAENLIELITLPIINPADGSCEYGVNKNRYNPLGPDGKIWDLDIYQGLNTGLYIAEIELEGKWEKVILPSWIGRRMNGYDKYKPFGTGELQKIPYQLMPQGLRNLFMWAQGIKVMR